MNAILIFTLATIVNVVLNTIRSIVTIKCGKWISATANAVCYGFYPLIVMLTAKDTVTIVVNMIITAIANFVCVWIIKFIEKKAEKDKLWKVEMAIPYINERTLVDIDYTLTLNCISFNTTELNSHWELYNCYCETQDQSAICAKLVKQYGGKISAYESKTIF